MSNEKLLELLKFTVNEKANIASSMMDNVESNSTRSHFYHGQYSAFSELYSMLLSIERTTNEED